MWAEYLSAMMKELQVVDRGPSAHASMAESRIKLLLQEVSYSPTSLLPAPFPCLCVTFGIICTHFYKLLRQAVITCESCIQVFQLVCLIFEATRLADASN